MADLRFTQFSDFLGLEFQLDIHDLTEKVWNVLERQKFDPELTAHMVQRYVSHNNVHKLHDSNGRNTN